jgi:signal peptidase I
MKNIVKGFAILLIVFLGCSLFVLSNNIGGWRLFIVKSGSMEPTITTGSLVINKYIHPTNLKTQDIVTFISPTQEREFITHRITAIKTEEEYSRISTKGDNNTIHDPWSVPGGSVVGKVMFTIPLMGYVMSFLQSKIGILLFILIPSIYIVVEEIFYVYELFKKKREKITLAMRTSD